ncbi:MAG: hypothetical protein ACYSWX_04130 [Planctomycetota bacterium]|jgi:hypothetical protein
MSNQEANVRPRLSPYCADLASKKVLLRSTPALVDRDVLDLSGHCWCARTQQVLGPDRDSVGPEDCRSGRSCFRSPYADLA